MGRGAGGRKEDGGGFGVGGVLGWAVVGDEMR
jgi:hypothetical protein